MFDRFEKVFCLLRRYSFCGLRNRCTSTSGADCVDSYSCIDLLTLKFQSILHFSIYLLGRVPKPQTLSIDWVLPLKLNKQKNLHGFVSLRYLEGDINYMSYLVVTHAQCYSVLAKLKEYLNLFKILDFYLRHSKYFLSFFPNVEQHTWWAQWHCEHLHS